MPYQISTERKQAILRKLLPPHNLSVAELARQEGVHTSPGARSIPLPVCV